MAWYNFFSKRNKRTATRRRRRAPRTVSFSQAQQPAVPSETTEQDLRAATQGGEAIRKKTQVVAQGLKQLRRQQPAVLNYERYRSARGLYNDVVEWVGPQYDLQEIAKALDTESYFARSVQRHIELILKNGFRLKGKDPERVRYLKRRLHEIALTVDQTTDSMIGEIVFNAVAFHNSFVIIKRDPLRSSGARTKWKGRTMDPMSGWYFPDPTTMSVKQTKSGLPVQWRQRAHNSGLLGHTVSRTDTAFEKKFPTRNVIHIALDKRSGWTFGTPYVIPVLDDIRLLRRMEELMDIIAHKHAFPLFVATVGTETLPAEDVEINGNMVSEVDLFKDQIEDMEFEGGLVVTERHTVEMIGAEGKALDLGPYLEHIEKRVIGGLRLSELDLGRGDSANRNTAQSITQILIDSCTRIQRVIESEITWKLIFPLLMEGGFNVRLDRAEEDMVYLDFPPIDTEERRNQENHEMALYQGSMIDEDEARGRSGMDPIEESNREKMYLERQQIPLIEAKADAEVRVVKAKAAAGGTGGGSSGTSSGSSSTRSTSNKNRPTNQHGTSPSKPKIARDRLKDSFVESAGGRWEEMIDVVVDGLDRSSKKGDLVEYHDRRIRSEIGKAIGSIVVDAETNLVPVMLEAFRVAAGDEHAMPAKSVRRFLDHHAKSSLNDLKDRGIQRVDLPSWSDEIPTRLRVRSTLEALHADLHMRSQKIAHQAWAYAFATGAKMAGAAGVVNKNEQQAFTFPVQPEDLVSPTADSYPELEVMED